MLSCHISRYIIFCEIVILEEKKNLSLEYICNNIYVFYFIKIRKYYNFKILKIYSIVPYV